MFGLANTAREQILAVKCAKPLITDAEGQKSAQFSLLDWRIASNNYSNNCYYHKRLCGLLLFKPPC